MKKWRGALTSLAPKTTKDNNYDTPLQELGLQYFNTKRNKDEDDEKMDISKIDFGSEEELLKARVFDFMRKEKIFGDFMGDSGADNGSELGSDSETGSNPDLD